jgi:hypothetical protein|tara:strand:+ start:2983 stop:3945 length:963 start_codon:yes stop_codon:yes gene_type:complete
MSVYKQFTTKEVTITPFNAQKDFILTGGEITGSDVGIDIYKGVKPTSNLFDPSLTTGLVYEENVNGVYQNIKQLYYSNYLSSSLGDDATTPILVAGVTPEYDRYIGGVTSPRYDNYLQSTLTQSRYFPTESNAEISVISIPSRMYGENIVPSTFEFEYTSSSGAGFNVKDDGEGNLVVNTVSGSSPGATPGQIVGQIFYPHGIATFTTSSLSQIGHNINKTPALILNTEIKYRSTFQIYENQYKVNIRENESGYSLNPSLLSGSLNDQYYSFVTGSDFVPYITTVGLYNDNKELLVVGKLSSPIPVSKFTDTVIVVNYDL